MQYPLCLHKTDIKSLEWKDINSLVIRWFKWLRSHADKLERPLRERGLLQKQI